MKNLVDQAPDNLVCPFCLTNSTTMLDTPGVWFCYSCDSIDENGEHIDATLVEKENT